MMGLKGLVLNLLVETRGCDAPKAFQCPQHTPARITLRQEPGADFRCHVHHCSIKVESLIIPAVDHIVNGVIAVDSVVEGSELR